MSAARSAGIAAAKVIVSLALVGYLLKSIGVSQVLARAGQLSVGAATVATLLLVVYIAVIAQRWGAVLRALGADADLYSAVRITFIGSFFNQFLPSTVGGDAVRIWEAIRSKLDVAPAVHSVLLERLGYLVCLSGIAALALSAWNDGRLPAGIESGLWIVFVSSVLAGIGVSLFDRYFQALLPTALRKHLSQLASDTRRVFRNPRTVALIAVSACANQLLLGAVVFLLAQDLDIQLSIVDCMALLPTVMLVSALPISIAGWGVREFAMVTALGHVGVTAAHALALSVLLALLSALAATPGAALWLTRRRDLFSKKAAPR